MLRLCRTEQAKKCGKQTYIRNNNDDDHNNNYYNDDDDNNNDFEDSKLSIQSKGFLKRLFNND